MTVEHIVPVVIVRGIATFGRTTLPVATPNQAEQEDCCCWIHDERMRLRLLDRVLGSLLGPGRRAAAARWIWGLGGGSSVDVDRIRLRGDGVGGSDHHVGDGPTSLERDPLRRQTCLAVDRCTVAAFSAGPCRWIDIGGQREEISKSLQRTDGGGDGVGDGGKLHGIDTSGNRDVVSDRMRGEGRREPAFSMALSAV